MSRMLAAVTLILSVSVSVLAQPTIGVYFDAEGAETHLQAGLGEINQAYVLVKNADMLLGGAAFRLDVEGVVNTLPPVHPPALVFGDLDTGLEIGLLQWAPQFGDDPVALAEFSFYSLEPVDLHWMVTNHPDYAAPMVASSDGVQHVAQGLTATIWLRLTPEIGVFFDDEATMTTGYMCNFGYNVMDAYLCIRQAEASLSGAAFRLDLDPRLTILESTPGPFQVDGSLTAGVDIRFDAPVPVFGTDNSLLYRLVFLAALGSFEGELQIIAHPAQSTPVVTTADETMLEAYGLHSEIYILCDRVENMAWGAVKSLYR